MANHEDDIPVIPRSHEPFDPNKVLFIGADGKPVTNEDMFDRFGCKIPNAGPDTPDERPADITIEREFFEDRIFKAPNGRVINIFGFKEPDGEPSFPSPTMRFREGQVVHSTFKSKKNTHTIHHHGIEPTNFNDGVGHTSFEVNGNYTYQFKASMAGTYFYHCHKNTVLHFEMGMYGFLIVDPPVAGAPFADGGPGMVRRVDEIIPYDVEALWAVDEIDTRWHKFINHKAGIACPFYHVDEDGDPKSDDNPRLNEFNPDIFLISGVPSDGTPILDPRVAVNAKVGQTILIRLLNAGYTTQEYEFDGLAHEVIEADGRPLGHTDKNSFSRPFTVPSNRRFKLTTAMRRGILIRPTKPGSYPFKVNFRHWISNRVLGRVETRINVT